jgi:ABC-type antimicrobial peptide transport system permease subunit
MRFRLLPWEYAVRNLFRRPLRSALTLGVLTVVVLLVFVLIGFVHGLDSSLQESGDPDVVLVYSLGAKENIENSVVSASLPGLLVASVDGIQQRYGVAHVSPELYLGIGISRPGDDSRGMGLIRGVTDAAPLVRRKVRLIEGAWPASGQVMVGRLAAAKLGFQDADLAVGRSVRIDGKDWPIAGRFSADGAAFESELWCRLEDLQQGLKRQDVSLVALLMAPEASIADVELFCKERTDLESQAIGEAEYYASLQSYYRPVRMLAWTIAALVAGSGVFSGFNAMYGAVIGRVREIAALQAIGYRRRAIFLSLMQESLMLAAAAALLAGAAALWLFNGRAVRFTMGAFSLRIDGAAIFLGCIISLLIGVFGAAPAAYRALRTSVVESLKAV